jgi:hypothetical protein
MVSREILPRFAQASAAKRFGMLGITATLSIFLGLIAVCIAIVYSLPGKQEERLVLLASRISDTTAVDDSAAVTSDLTANIKALNATKRKLAKAQNDVRDLTVQNQALATKVQEHASPTLPDRGANVAAELRVQLDAVERQRARLQEENNHLNVLIRDYQKRLPMQDRKPLLINILPALFAASPTGFSNSRMIIVYSVLVLLALLFVVSVWIVFFGKDEKRIAMAGEWLKMLIAFFIGIVSSALGISA